MFAATFLSELLDAVRSLRRAPGFAMLALATLAAGIGANVALFSVFDSIVLSPLPYRDADRLVGFTSFNAGKALSQPALSAADFRDVHAAARSYSALAAFRPDFASYAPSGGHPVQVVAALVTEEFFSVFAIPPQLGRAFVAEEYSGTAPRTAMISRALWRREFGGADEVVGRTITLDKKPTTIIGIMPHDFREPEFVDVWLPFDRDSGENLARDSRYWTTVGRLKPDVSVASARAEAAALAATIAHENPAVNKGWTFIVTPLLEQRIGSVRRTLLLLIAAVGLVLVVACVNLANLLLARGVVRMPQLAVRLALGASPGALARGVLYESLLLAITGGAAGVLLAAAALQVITTHLPVGMLPRSHAISLDGSAVGFALGLILLTGSLFGILPAWQVRQANVHALLKASGMRTASHRFTSRLQAGLIVGQISLTVVVLTTAALLVRGLLQLQRVSPGFDPAGVLAVQIAPGIEGWQDPVALDHYYVRLLDQLQRTPGVEHAAINCSAPLTGVTLRYPFWVQGRPRTEGNADEAVFCSVSPDFLRTLEVPLRHGRFIESRDDHAAPLVCVINEALARRIFPDEDPIGKRLQTVPWLARSFREVVGVVADTRQDNLADAPPPQIYVPSAQSPWFFTTILVRASTGVGATTIQAALRRADPALAMTIRSMADNIALTTLAPQMRAGLFALFGAAALALSAFGLYASMAFTVSQRTREIGVRMALGASGGDILRWVLTRALRLGLAGAATGLPAAWMVTRVLRGWVNELPPTEPLLVLAIAGFLVAVALAAGAHPAWRAARLNPTRALQDE